MNYDFVKDGIFAFTAGCIIKMSFALSDIARDLHTIATHLTNQ